VPGTPRIWPRNSYVLGTLHPLLSDLDVTVWFDSEPTRAQLEQLARVLKWCRRAFPFLGETNLYVAGEARSQAGLANALELARDPELLGRLKAVGPVATVGKTGAQAAAFVLRMLEGDIAHVLERPEARRAKWESHGSAVAQALGGNPPPLWNGFPERTLLRGIVELAVFALAPATDADHQGAVASLERYFQCMGRGVPLHTLRIEPWWWACLPHRFCFGSEPPLPLKGEQAEIFLAQLAWEAWGLLGQRRLALLRGQDPQGHLAALKRVLAVGVPPASGGAASLIAQALERLSEGSESR
jgi:hypothetical protein